MRPDVPPEDPSKNFTLVITTYNRQDIYIGVLEHYCVIPEIDRVLLIWNNPTWDPPLPSMFNCPAPVLVLQQKDSQVQNRIRNTPEYIRTEAIFQVDDDIYFNTEDVRLAFRIWQGHKNSMVGFQPRNHYSKGDTWVYSHHVTTEFTMMIGAAHFINSKMYRLYASDSEIPNKLRLLVEELSCCDDIGMNFLNAWAGGEAPVW
eukprot:CAMPEP_0174250482 /NCGR_PEP_ID=MMETSP0439-20130205/643_1 /TAXON_ID=0 /ORGANISM="Stereomyxa ramosa, Strain Chinc5" /LENGTH=202 /DNA_ID=CAMNT_0015330569 /DNA_START=315 /DNA_END=920 /DNA_ORIENTATION=+